MKTKRVRILGSGLHTPTQFFRECLPGYQDCKAGQGKTAEREGLLLKRWAF